MSGLEDGSSVTPVSPLEGIEYVTTYTRFLQTDETSRKYCPNWPKIHDLAFLSFNTKTIQAIDAAERFFVHMDESGGLRKQDSSPSREGEGGDDDNGSHAVRRSIRRMTRDMALKIESEKLTDRLEQVVALNNQIIAGHYRKPEEPNSRLEKMEMKPWFRRPLPTEIPEPRNDYQNYRDTLFDPAFIPRLHPRADADYVGIRSEMTPEAERFRIILRLDKGLKPLGTKPRREQDGGRPSLVVREHVPLSRVEKLPHRLAGSLPSVASLVERAEMYERAREQDSKNEGRRYGTDRASGDSPADQINQGYYHMHDGNSIEATHLPELKNSTGGDGQIDEEHGEGHSTTLPSISEVFANDDFMTSFAEQAKQHRTRPTAPRDFDIYTVEEGHRAVQPHLTRTMAQCYHRIVFFHNFTGRPDVVRAAEYFPDRNRGFPAARHWVGVEGNDGERVEREGTGVDVGEQEQEQLKDMEIDDEEEDDEDEWEDDDEDDDMFCICPRPTPPM